MKKAKIMLMSIALVAVVGGALAFKASKSPTRKYCYSTTAASDPTTQICSLVTTFNIGQAGVDPILAYAAFPSGGCLETTPCTTSTTLTFE